MARYMRTYGKSRLGAPAVVSEEAAFVAEPIRVYFRNAVQSTLIQTQAGLRRKRFLERIPITPKDVPVVSDENPAPNIYGYGAM